MVFRFTPDDDQDSTEPTELPESIDPESAWRRRRGRGVLLSTEDSEYVGSAMESWWSWDDTSSVTKHDMMDEIERRLTEVSQRGERSWDGWAQRKNGSIIDNVPSLYTLDPTEDVDDSTWLEKGHFREPKDTRSVTSRDSLRISFTESERIVSARSSIS